MTPQISIVNGPSREDLRDSLGSKPRKRLLVEFQIGSNPHLQTTFISTMINGMEWEDGSGESFIIKGYYQQESTMPWRAFSGYYRTDKRTGFIQFEV